MPCPKCVARIKAEEEKKAQEQTQADISLLEKKLS
jgi:hypothetical protein